MQTVDRFGKYEVVRRIGAGGFGVVFEAFDPRIRRPVAIKTCPSDDPRLRARFAREAEITGNLMHPNITVIFDYGEENGVPYLVQEFLHGEDLSEPIQRQDAIPLSVRLTYLIDTASALAYAHQEGVIHRDVKPSNIRVLENGRVKVMDFGIARLKNDASLTVTGRTVGTAAYLAPEQLRNETLDRRSDIFSFGVTAYELITTERAFPGFSPSQILFGVLNEEPTSILELAPACPPALAALISRCYRKDRAERFDTLDDVVPRLEQLRSEARERERPIPVLRTDRTTPMALDVTQRTAPPASERNEEAWSPSPDEVTPLPIPIPPTDPAPAVQVPSKTEPATDPSSTNPIPSPPSPRAPTSGPAVPGPRSATHLVPVPTPPERPVAPPTPRPEPVQPPQAQAGPVTSLDQMAIRIPEQPRYAAAAELGSASRRSRRGLWIPIVLVMLVVAAGSAWLLRARTSTGGVAQSSEEPVSVQPGNPEPDNPGPVVSATPGPIEEGGADAGDAPAAAAPASTPPEQEQVVVAATGVVIVPSAWSPSATVSIDGGARISLEASRRFELSPGQHRLDFLVPGPGGGSARRTVDVLAEEEQTVRMPIAPPGAMSVRMSPGVAQVYVWLDGRLIGRSPVQQQVARPGQRALRLTRGQQSGSGAVASLQVDLRSGEELILTFGADGSTREVRRPWS